MMVSCCLEWFGCTVVQKKETKLLVALAYDHSTAAICKQQKHVDVNLQGGLKADGASFAPLDTIGIPVWHKQQYETKPKC